MNYRRSLMLLLGLALVRGLIYAAVTPPWQAPDETGHFEYAWLIAHEGRLPSTDDLSPAFERELLSSLYEWRFGEFTTRPLPDIMPTRLQDLPANVFARASRTVLAGRFSLAYLWQALFLLPVSSQDLEFQLMVGRFSSVVLNLGIVWLAFAIFRGLMPARPRVALAMALIVVLMPQHTFINSAVNDGTLAELMACLVLWCWVQVFLRGTRPTLIAGIALGTCLAVLSKATGAFLLPLDVALALWWLVRRRQLLWMWGSRRFAYLGIGVLALGFGAWAATHSGLGTHMRNSISVLMSAPTSPLLDARGTTLAQALLGSHDSFWAFFGWMAVPLSQRWYGALLLLAAIAAAGWLMGNKGDLQTPSWAPIMMAATFLFAFGAFVWAALLVNSSGLYQIQGRYLFPAVVPCTFLLVGGWLRLLSDRRQNVLFGGVLFLAVLDAWSIMGYIIPYFYYR